MTPVTPLWRRALGFALTSHGFGVCLFLALAVASFVTGGTTPRWILGIYQLIIVMGYLLEWSHARLKRSSQELIDLQRERIADLECALEARDQLMGVVKVTGVSGQSYRMQAGDVFVIKFSPAGYSVKLLAETTSAFRIL